MSSQQLLMPSSARNRRLGRRCTIGGERVDGLSVQQDVDFHQIRRLESAGFVVEARIALCSALQLIEEVDDDLGEGDGVDELECVRPRDRSSFFLAATPGFRLRQLHDRVPVYSTGVMIVTVSIGSSMWSMFCGGGRSDGFETSSSAYR